MSKTQDQQGSVRTAMAPLFIAFVLLGLFMVIVVMALTNRSFFLKQEPQSTVTASSQGETTGRSDVQNVKDRNTGSSLLSSTSSQPGSYGVQGVFDSTGRPSSAQPSGSDPQPEYPQPQNPSPGDNTKTTPDPAKPDPSKNTGSSHSVFEYFEKLAEPIK